MLIKEEKSAIVEKTEELCKTILEQPLYRELKQKIDAFFNHAEIQPLYQRLCARQQTLQEKQQSGQALTDEEMDAFEKDRSSFFDHEIARNFVDAQQKMNKVLETVHSYVTKTLEFGRMPTEEDFQSGCCGGSGGGGCGCQGG